MNKRGFTLIELLAVIVILAIIALIATPIVLNIIKDSRESAGLRSAEMYLKGVETSVAAATINNKKLKDGTYPITKAGDICLVELTNNICDEDNTLEVEMNGEKPESGTVTIENGKITDISLTYTNGKPIVKKDGKLVYSDEKNETGKVEYTAYSIGDEVTVGGENFYVIANSDEENPNVTLLAKYNLNLEGTAQSNAEYVETACVFSSTNYWSNETEYPLNLNDYTIPEGVTSLITTAKAYGAAKGETGRLMTKEEAETLATNYAGIIYGKTINATSGFLCYWLDSAESTETVLLVFGGSNTMYSSNYDMHGNMYGLRPVVEISKSKIN